MTARETADRLAEMTGGFDLRGDAIEAALTDAYRRGEESRPKVKPLETTEYERDEFDNHPGDFDHVDFARRLIRDITRLTAQVAALKEERDALRRYCSAAASDYTGMLAALEQAGGNAFTDAFAKVAKELRETSEFLILASEGLADGTLYDDELTLAHGKIRTAEAERDAANTERKAVEAVATYWQHKAIDTEAERDAANARAERLAGALRDAMAWVEECNGAWNPTGWRRDQSERAQAIDAALTEPEAKGGDPAPEPATTEKTDD